MEEDKRKRWRRKEIREAGRKKRRQSVREREQNNKKVREGRGGRE